MLAISDISNKLTFDLLTLKVVSESRVTWATSVPIAKTLSVLELGPMYATDRQMTDKRQTKASLNASALWGGGIIIVGMSYHFRDNRRYWSKAANFPTPVSHIPVEGVASEEARDC